MVRSQPDRLTGRGIQLALTRRNTDFHTQVRKMLYRGWRMGQNCTRQFFELFQTIPHDQALIRANPALTKRPSEVAVSKTSVILMNRRSVIRDARIRPASIPTNVAGMSAVVTFNVAGLTPAIKACNVIATG